MVRRKTGINLPEGPYGKQYKPRGIASEGANEITLASAQFRQLLEAHVITRFKWNNLPESINERYLERVLMTEGHALAFISETGLPLALKGVSQGMGNLYGDPISFRAFGEFNWQEAVPLDKGVWIWENMVRSNPMPVIYRYARKLAEIDLLQDDNRAQQRQVVVLAGTEDSMMDLQYLAKAMRMPEKSVQIIDKSLINENPLQVLATGVKYLQEDFNADKRAIFNDFFDHFGIDHMRAEKKAHVLETEANIANDSIARVRENALLPRQEAAKKMSELFGREITVEWRQDQFDILNESDSNPKTPEESE